MGWDVNVDVHVTADDVTMIVGWDGVGWGVNVHVHVTLMMLR